MIRNAIPMTIFAAAYFGLVAIILAPDGYFVARPATSTVLEAQR